MPRPAALAGEAGRERLARYWQQVRADLAGHAVGYSCLRAVTGAYCDFLAADRGRAGLGACGVPACPRGSAQGASGPLLAPRRLPGGAGGSGAALRAGGLTCAILSQKKGRPRCWEGGLIRRIGAHLDAVLSRAEVGTFKPDARVFYDMVCGRFGGSPGAFLFVSSTGWDIRRGGGLTAFRTLWCEPRRACPLTALPGRPTIVADPT